MAAHDVYDPYGNDHDPDGQDPVEVLKGFIVNIEEFMDYLFRNPPPALRGDWLDAQGKAWQELRHQISRSVAPLVEEGLARQSEHSVEQILDQHGLRGGPLRMKINEWRDKTRAFFQLQSAGRLSPALHTGGLIVESIADCAGPAGAALKEAVKGLKHLTDIAVKEGS